MGRYINRLADGTPVPVHGKAAVLIRAGAKEVAAPTRAEDFQPNLVCVVSNGLFEAAAYAYSVPEMLEFARPDGRPKMWLVVPDVEQIAK